MLLARLGPADVPDVLAALRTASDVAYPGDELFLRESLADVLAGCGLGAVVRDSSGKVAAVAVALTDDDEFELALLWTRAKYRRRGLARAMLSTFGPVWGSAVITATLGSRSDPVAAGALLRELAFRPRPAGQSTVWCTRRIRRTRGRASVVPAAAGQVAPD